jgi:Protein of unknown function (DUF2612)
MPVNPFVVTDFIAQSKEQATEQFKDKVVFNKYVALLLAGSVEMMGVLRDLMQLRSIDTAVGEQLDVLGRIVGQDRVLIGADAIKYFGFNGTTLSSTFGSSSNNALGGYWYSYGKPLGGNILLNDTQYRLFIKAKIKKNTTDATANSVMDFLSFVFGVRCTLTVSAGAKATILVSRKLSDFERALVDLQDTSGSYFVPRPLGVELTIEEPTSDGTLGFLGTPGALGMISLYAINPNGGVFGSIYSGV